MSQNSFTVTDAAKEQILSSLKKRSKGMGVRVGVKTTGCSGMAYTLAYVDEANESDHRFDVAENASVFIDPKAFEYLKGSTMDYIKRGLNEGFEFINPNEKGRCGCGESFTV
jgi:iron-sulfur cluster assembly protein